MVEFICKGLLDMRGAQTEKYKMKNSCQQWDPNLGTFASENNSLSAVLLVEISTLVFYLNYLYQVVDVEK